MKISPIAVVVPLFVAGSAFAQVTNGSFENYTANLDIAYISELDQAQGGLSTVDNVGVASGWTFGSNAGLLGGNTTDGDIAAWLNPGGFKSGNDAFISQNLLLGGGSYVIDFDSFASPWQFETLYNYEVDITNLVSGTTVFSTTLYEDAFDGLPTAHSFGFNAGAGSYALTFTGLPVPQYLAATNGDVFIDDVAIKAVPEPGAAVLAILGVLAFIYRRRH